jgi:hypothetical protein
MKIASKLVAAAAATAVILGAGLASPAAWSADEKAAEKPKVSKVAAKPLQAAKKALDDKKFPEALEKLKEVEGISDTSTCEPSSTPRLPRLWKRGSTTVSWKRPKCRIE